MPEINEAPITCVCYVAVGRGGVWVYKPNGVVIDLALLGSVYKHIILM